MIEVRMGKKKMHEKNWVKFELWRQDENGNVFKIGEFPARAVAERRLAELTSNLHKQTYWIKEIPASIME